MTESAQITEADPPGPKKDWWFPVSGRIMKDLRIHPGARYVWLVLQAYKDTESSAAWPTYERLQTLTGIGRDALLVAINELEAMGVIERKRNTNGSGMKRGWVFYPKPVNWDCGIRETPYMKQFSTTPCFQGLNSGPKFSEPNRASETDPGNTSKTKGVPAAPDTNARLLRLIEHGKRQAEILGLPEHVAVTQAERIATEDRVKGKFAALTGRLAKIAEDRKPFKSKPPKRSGATFSPNPRQTASRTKFRNSLRFIPAMFACLALR